MIRKQPTAGSQGRAKRSKASLRVALVPDNAVLPVELKASIALVAGDLLKRLPYLFKAIDDAPGSKVIVVPFEGHELEALVPLARVIPVESTVFAAEGFSDTDIVWRSAAQSLGLQFIGLEAALRERSLSGANRSSGGIGDDPDPTAFSKRRRPSPRRGATGDYDFARGREIDDDDDSGPDTGYGDFDDDDE